MRIKKMKVCPTHNPNCIPPKPTVFDCIRKVAVWTFDHTLLAVWHLYVGFLDAMVFSDLGTKGPEVMAVASIMTVVFFGIAAILLCVVAIAIGAIVYYTKISLIVIGVIGAVIGAAYAASRCCNT